MKADRRIWATGHSRHLLGCSLTPRASCSDCTIRPRFRAMALPMKKTVMKKAMKAPMKAKAMKSMKASW